MQDSVDPSRRAIKKLILNGNDKGLQTLLNTPEGRAAIVRGDAVGEGWLMFALDPDAHNLISITAGLLRCIQLLAPIVKRGWTCESKGQKEWTETALIVAIKRSNLALVKVLAPYCDPLYHSPRSEENALSVAMLHCQSLGRVEIVQYLLSTIEPHRLQELDRNGDSLLCKAAAQCPPELFAQFLVHMDPKGVDQKGWTPLMHAARSGNLENLLTLLPLSDVHAKEWPGRELRQWDQEQKIPECRNALDLALEIEKVEVVDRLSEWADEGTLRGIIERFNSRVPRAVARQEALDLTACLSAPPAAIDWADCGTAVRSEHVPEGLSGTLIRTSSETSAGASSAPPRSTSQAEAILKKRGLRL